jgi:hypothetical protein
MAPSKSQSGVFALLLLSFLLLNNPVTCMLDTVTIKLETSEGLNRSDQAWMREQEKNRNIELRRQGYDVLGYTPEAAALRNYRLRKMKSSGMLFRKRERSLSSVLFPGIPPITYQPGEEMMF